jgi:hypothetical protein
MAEKNRYPQIPSTVWWGVRAILQKTPNATVDERLLSVQLDVQEAAARAYLGELKAIGILTDDCKATPLAHKWRLDDEYSEAVERLVAEVYPEGLIHVAPPGEGDRQKIVSWFLKEGLGQGAAGNKAATYLLLSSPTPNESPSRSSGRAAKNGNTKRIPKPKSGQSLIEQHSSASAGRAKAPIGKSSSNGSGSRDAFPLNINVQIHISADAGTEQIESIFSAMRRYLYDTQSN